MSRGNNSGLHLYGVSKRFGDHEVIGPLNLSVEVGEFISVCGKSGVGKSTLLRLISGLTPASTGEIIYSGEVITTPPLGLGMVTQNYSASLLPWLTVRKNVELPLLDRGMTKREIDEVVINRLLEVGLEDKGEKFPREISGGMQQRVAIARALALNPKLLLLDEPFASLDAMVRFELEDLVSNLVKKTGVTSVLVTHDVEEAIYMSDRVVVLSGSPASIAQDIRVELGRPRNQIQTRSEKRFLGYRADILDVLFSQP